jgi:hypothetical protein
MPRTTPTPLTPLPDDVQTAVATFVVHPQRQVPKGLLKELRSYLAVHDLLPAGLHLNQANDVQKAQEALVALEARFDRVVAVHFDAKVILQRFVTLETMLYGVLGENGQLARLPKHQQELNLRLLAPKFFALRGKWELIEDLCSNIQRRLETSRDTLKLMQKLDDHLQWALHRNP